MIGGLITGAILSGLAGSVFSQSAPGNPVDQTAHNRVQPPPVPLSTPDTAAEGIQPPPISDPAPSPPTVRLKPLNAPAVKAYSSIVMDAVSGQVLYAHDADTPRPMASTTKIMTALLFCEHVPESDTITASKCACDVHESSLHLKLGEKLSAHDLLRAILMRSANDACVAAAEHIAGSEAAFVEMMNAKAGELGATRTHFTNPHGLQSPDHYTTARDLALIARAAMQEARIREVVGTKVCRIQRSVDKQDVHLRNHSHFLGHFPGADGVKTGWTRPAGHCYVGSATWGGWRLITVVLHSPDYVGETAALMKFGFSNFERHVVAKAGEEVGACAVLAGTRPSVPADVQQPLQVITRKGEQAQIERHILLNPVAAPVTVGMPVGTLEAYLNGKPVCGTPLISGQADPSAAAQSSNASPWRRLGLASGILVTGLVSLRYGTRITALTKSARRRRRRFAQSLRSDDHRRQSFRQREDG